MRRIEIQAIAKIRMGGFVQTVYIFLKVQSKQTVKKGVNAE